MRDISKLVAIKATELWQLNVYDPETGESSPNAIRCKEIISTFTRACNWGDYKGNHSVEWCAMFAMFCWYTAANLDPTWLAHFSQSTFRLWCWATYQDFLGHRNPKPKSGDLRTYIDLRTVADYTTAVSEGDIVIVGDGNPKTGDHVTVAVAVGPNWIDTISGNGGGVNAAGKKNNGISRKTFERNSGDYRPMFVVIPASGDLLAEAPQAA